MRGDGRIYRPKGRKVLMLAYYVGPRDARRVVRESARTEDEATARKRLARRLREAANAQEGIADFEEPTHRRVTVNVLFDELLADYRLRGIKGLRHVELKFVEVGKRTKRPKPLRAVFGSRHASSVTTAEVSRYMKRRKEEGAANATVNREVELLRRAFRLGVESGRIVRAPAFPAKLPEKKARQGFFETGDFARVLPHLPEPLDEMARFAFETGWRRGMVIGMKWEHVDRIGRLVTLPDSKNDDPQTMPLDGELWDVIERRWKAREYPAIGGAVGVSEYVFHRGGKPIPTSTFDTQFRKAREDAGLAAGRVFHDLRRTAARNMVRGGVPQSIAMRVTGHRSNAMFQRYDITSTADKLEALQKARIYAQTRAAVGENVAAFPEQAHERAHVKEKARLSEGFVVAVQGFEPRTQRI